MHNLEQWAKLLHQTTTVGAVFSLHCTFHITIIIITNGVVIVIDIYHTVNLSIAHFTALQSCLPIQITPKGLWPFLARPTCVPSIRAHVVLRHQQRTTPCPVQPHYHGIVGIRHDSCLEGCHHIS
jgi:hypothetical protein